MGWLGVPVAPVDSRSGHEKYGNPETPCTFLLALHRSDGPSRGDDLHRSSCLEEGWRKSQYLEKNRKWKKSAQVIQERWRWLNHCFKGHFKKHPKNVMAWITRGCLIWWNSASIRDSEVSKKKTLESWNRFEKVIRLYDADLIQNHSDKW